MIKQKLSASTFWSLTIIYAGYMLLFADRTLFNLTLAYIGKDLNMSTVALGAASSAFFLGYTLMQIPGGYLTDKFGAKVIIIFTLAAWSLLTLATGLVWSLTVLVAVRFLFGLAQGPYPAAALKQVRQEVVKKHHAQLTAVVLSSNYAGAAIAPFVLVPMLVAVGWRDAYHIVGVVGLVVMALFWLLNRSKVRLGKLAAIKFKWRDVDAHTWVFVFLGLVLNIITKGLETWMPVYFLTKRHINLSNLAWLVPLPTIAGGIAAFVSGYLLVKFFKYKERWLIILACCLCLVAMIGLWSAKTLAMIVVCECLIYFFKSLAFTGIFSFCASIFAQGTYGSAISVVNFGGQLGGFIGPLYIGWLVAVAGSYSSAFLGLACCALLAAIVSWFVGSSPKMKIVK